MKKYFVTGNGTEVGKTFVSAILVEALKADYWKPIQAGDLENSDSKLVRSLVSNTQSKFHTEGVLLSQPMSPHAAARIDGIDIKLESFLVPETENDLIIEGAGGLMVPINDNGDLIVDLIKYLDVEVIVVSRNYLGSINHTLLTFEVLKEKGWKVKGVIFNGEPNAESEEYILKYTGVELLGRIGNVVDVNKGVVEDCAAKFVNVL